MALTPSSNCGGAEPCGRWKTEVSGDTALHRRVGVRPFRPAFYGKPVISGLVFIFGISLILCACARSTIQFAEIDEGKIPQPVRQYVAGQLKFSADRGESLRNLKWRVLDERDDYTLAICTYERTQRIPGPRPGDPVIERDEIAFMMVEYEPTTMRFGGAVSVLDGLPPKQMFHWAGQSGAVWYGDSAKNIQAYGWCIDPKVEKIVGITSLAKKLETSPVGGFWYLRCGEPAEKETYIKVEALDARGKVLYEADWPPK